MRWLVDGMNLMGSRPDGWWRDRAGARRRLVGELATFVAAAPGDQVTVVFDGRWQPDEVAAGDAVGVAVAFAPGGPDAADRVIADLARADPDGLTVVTSDRALVARVEAAGVPVVGVAAFRRLLP
ncbi:MAG TPA: NYN domain-containing protein [Acidimicrobiales bacterium]|nr:NYN domain-containing protein [Acidimicrobiales bacterium]